jgi:hypothetical protein
MAALGLLLAACGGGESTRDIASLQEETADTGSSTTVAAAAAADPEQAMLDFTQCMRDHDTDMPDPQVSTANGGFAFDITIQGEVGAEGGPDSAEIQKMQEAHEACKHFLEGMVQQFERPDMTEMQDQMLAFSQCMRDHGVDYPDPVFSEDGGVTIMGPDEGGGGPVVDPSDPAFQEAQEACQEVFGGQGGPMTVFSGPGDGGAFVGPGGGEAPDTGTGDSSGGG